MKGELYTLARGLLYLVVLLIAIKSLFYAERTIALPCDNTTPRSRYAYWLVDQSKPKIPDKGRYITFNTHNNGLSYQWIELQHAVYMAIILNRTLILPPKDPLHSWGEYFDLEDLGRRVSITTMAQIPNANKLTETINDITWSANKTLGSVFVLEKRPANLTSPEGKPVFGLYDNYRANRFQLIRFTNLYGGRNFFYLGEIFEERLLFATNNYLHYTDELFVKALRIVDRLPPGFAAAHIRTTDVGFDRNYTHEMFMPKMVSSTTRIYIATDDTPSEKAGEVLRQTIGNTFYSFANFTHWFEDSRVQLQANDYRAALEQIVCMFAKQFFGTRGSTFSAKVVKMRSLHRQTFMLKHYDSFP